MKKLMKYLRGYGKEAVLGPFFKLLEAAFELFVPLVVAKMIDESVAGAGSAYLVKMSLLLVALGAVGFAASVTAQYFAAKAAVGFAARLRHAVFEKIQALSWSDIDRLGTSSLLTRLTGDINTLQNGVNLVLRLFLRSPFIVFGAAVMAFFVDVRAALIFVVVIPVLSIVVFTVMLLSISLYKKVQLRLEVLLGITRENISGARVIRAFSREDAAEERFDAASDALNVLQKLAGKVSSLTNPLTYVILNGAVVLLIYTGALRVNAGVITVGAVVALFNYMSQILTELIKLANLIITVTRAFACAGRISDTLDMPVGEEGELTSDSECAVEFSDVSLRYNGSPESSLHSVSFSARKGEITGIIGSTGSGKSSLVNMIPRFYEASEGEVKVLGLDVKKWNPRQLRRSVAVVPQKAVLFSGTVRDNLLWGDEDAAEEDLIYALKAACAYDFVMKSGGLDASVAQGGKNFSGGQRQRLTIARALVRHAPLLILDDSASALDPATEKGLRENLTCLPWKPAVFIVSQRTSSVMHADRILVLEDGELAASGTHEELLSHSDVYREIYSSQFGEADAV